MAIYRHKSQVYIGQAPYKPRRYTIATLTSVVIEAVTAADAASATVTTAATMIEAATAIAAANFASTAAVAEAAVATATASADSTVVQVVGPPVFFGVITAAQLLLLGGRGLPLSDPGVPGQIWNNNGEGAISP